MHQGQLFATPEEALEHFGVKGMKWGVRKERASSTNLTGLVKEDIVRTTPNGDVLTLSAKPPNKFNKAMAFASKNYAESYNKGAWLTIKDKQGKKIGDANLWHKSDKELYLNWISINKSARGQGYATEILKAAAQYGQAKGLERMILEVPGNAPDARHIYEKLGFEVTRELAPRGSALWDGLTEMEYKFDKG